MREAFAGEVHRRRSYVHVHTCPEKIHQQGKRFPSFVAGANVTTIIHDPSSPPPSSAECGDRSPLRRTLHTPPMARDLFGPCLLIRDARDRTHVRSKRKCRIDRQRGIEGRQEITKYNRPCSLLSFLSPFYDRCLLRLLSSLWVRAVQRCTSVCVSNSQLQREKHRRA